MSLLVMVHDDVDAFAEASEKQFETLWSKRGWTVLDEPHAYASRLFGRKVTKLADLKAEELERLVKSRRLEPGANKAENELLFAGTFEAAEPAAEAPKTPATAPAGNTPTPKAPAADKNKDKE